MKYQHIKKGEHLKILPFFVGTVTNGHSETCVHQTHHAMFGWNNESPERIYGMLIIY